MRVKESEGPFNDTGHISPVRLSVERVDPSELKIVARVLAEAYFQDPIHVWAMPRAATRIADATVFFMLFLRWMRPYNWDVLATVDRSAVLVKWLVRQDRGGYPDGVRYMPALLRTKSYVTEYFRWIDTHRPKVDHEYIEFIGCLPHQRSKGLGSFILKSMLAEADQEDLPVWTWSSNPLNLTFYRRLGFEIIEELQRDADTPPVTVIWRPPTSLLPSSTLRLRTELKSAAK